MAQVKAVGTASARLSYEVVGEGPVICLIASAGRGPWDFAGLAERLAVRGYRVLLPVPRGLGESRGPLDGIDFHDLAADVAAVVDAEGGSAIVAGHAYGCWIARTLAEDRPDLVRGLVFLAAGAERWPAELTDAIDTASDPGAARAARIEALRTAFFAPGHDPTGWLDGWSSDLIAAQRAARARTDPDSWTASGSAPILDLVGAQDPFRPAERRSDYVERFGARVTLEVIDGASHALPDERPGDVAARMDRWIAAL
ncbi:alpha/beta hydrolase [Psychromarinibacter sp. C21-152]|uniref:Alpha/beta hydrolase n=1 Tax=Psychromarinibacter sediminicola TaxID=3033385 RepID=A0AAE3NNR7_9RHOB|nr:alpha/beta hydrolase [Psychromarinibacter sediminicola]MDF0601383.1 alpha/beta hydrolase [Psychromarinibacter sediminicola]